MEKGVEIEIKVIAEISGCGDEYDRKKILLAYMAKLRNLCVSFRTGERAATAEAEMIGGGENGESGD